MKTMKTSGVLALALTSMLVAGCSANSSSNTAPPPGQAVMPPGGTTTPANADEQQNKVQIAEATTQSKDKISLKRNFYFVFDGSGSMASPPTNGYTDTSDQRSKIEGAKWAVHEFLKKVPDDVNLGLFVFDRRGARQAIPLAANNRQKFLAAIDRVEAHGATPLGAAISVGAEQLSQQYKRQLGYGEYRLIVITDGEATDNLASGVHMAERMQIPIYTIGFDMGEQHSLRKHSIAYRSASSASEVEQALEQAAEELDVFDPTAFPQQHAKARG